MFNIQKVMCVGLILCFVSGNLLFAQSDSTLPIQKVSKTKLQKANGDVAAYSHRIAQRGEPTDQLKQGKFTIVINALNNGQYELQIYRMVSVGKKKVSSIFASLYRAGIEYSYDYDEQRQEIRQYHFLCPPNSLTCWADPQDYEIFQQFKWQEKFPSKSCNTSVFTSEEYGREYMQASCFTSREAALVFGQKFIDYITGDRGVN